MQEKIKSLNRLGNAYKNSQGDWFVHYTETFKFPGMRKKMILKTLPLEINNEELTDGQLISFYVLNEFSLDENLKNLAIINK